MSPGRQLYARPRWSLEQMSQLTFPWMAPAAGGRAPLTDYTYSLSAIQLLSAQCQSVIVDGRSSNNSDSSRRSTAFWSKALANVTKAICGRTDGEWIVT